MGRRQGGPSRTGSKKAHIFALRTSLFDFFGAYPGFRFAHRFAPPQAFIRPRLRRLRASVLGHRQKRNHRETQARQRLVRMGVAAEAGLRESEARLRESEERFSKAFRNDWPF
jgi:hypothetical protein